MLTSLNQQAPKMHYQPLPPYTPTIAVDNGPAFNSKELGNFSTARGILIMNSYPYHPQGNEAEYFMKPFRKAVKIAIVTSRPSQQAADDLISDYRSSTHPATGVAPGNMFFHGGYKSTDQPKFIKYDFPDLRHPKPQQNDCINPTCLKPVHGSLNTPTMNYSMLSMAYNPNTLFHDAKDQLHK